MPVMWLSLQCTLTLRKHSRLCELAVKTRPPQKNEVVVAETEFAAWSAVVFSNEKSALKPFEHDI